MAEAPVITSAVANAPGWITIGWAHSGQDGALGYRVKRKSPAWTWPYLTHVGLHTDMGLTPSTAYEYQVCSVYAGGVEECSSWHSVQTQPPEEQPPVYTRPPPTISAHEVGPDYIVIKWSGRAYERIHLRWKEDTPGASRAEAEIQFDHGRSVGYRRFDNLRASTRYTFRIQGCDLNVIGVAKCGPTSWPPFPITTAGAPLPPPPPPLKPIYAVTNEGTLLWFRHEGQQDGSFRWSADKGKNVGYGWGGFSTVFSGGDGVIYAIEERSRDPRTGAWIGGNLLWYRHDGSADGADRWAASVGKTVGRGWSGLTHVFSGGGGVIYALRGNGELLWNRHEGRDDGTFRWTYSEGRSVAAGWRMKQALYGANRMFSGGNEGAIYALMDNGDLMWFKHEGYSDGTDRWLSEEGRKVGHEWRVKDVFAVGDGGVIYARAQNDDLLWFRHDGQRTGRFEWSPGSGSKVGHGWAVKQVFGG